MLSALTTTLGSLLEDLHIPDLTPTPAIAPDTLNTLLDPTLITALTTLPG